MFKLLGACLIIGGCGYSGLKIAAVYQKRTDTLRVLQNGLNLLETEISYTATPLPLALERVGKRINQNTGIIFTAAGDILQDGKGCSVSEAWARGLIMLNEVVPLLPEEENVLALFGQGLGSSAREEQVKNITLAKEQLAMAEKTAREAKEKNKKMWQYLGFCLGAVLVLLLV